jgi:hypothetical protein
MHTGELEATSLNRLSTGTSPDFAYDAAGNLTIDTVHSFTFDAENPISLGAGVTYYYDADGKRARKSTTLKGGPLLIGKNNGPITGNSDTGPAFPVRAVEWVPVRTYRKLAETVRPDIPREHANPLSSRRMEVTTSCG